MPWCSCSGCSRRRSICSWAEAWALMRSLARPLGLGRAGADRSKLRLVGESGVGGLRAGRDSGVAGLRAGRGSEVGRWALAVGLVAAQAALAATFRGPRSEFWQRMTMTGGVLGTLALVT